MGEETQTFIIDTYSKIIQQLSSQKEILQHSVERMDNVISTLTITNERLSTAIDSMSHNIPEKIRESMITCNNDVIKALEEASNRIKTLKDGFDAGFIEGTKEMEKMKNRINFLYAAFVIIVMQLVAILIKVWF